MRKVLFIILILIGTLPAVCLSHPGKTDRQGGHKCWKDCGEWELAYGEYHLHDKEYKPIRVDRPFGPAAPSDQNEPEPPSSSVTVTPKEPNIEADRPPAAKKAITPSTQETPAVVREENLFPVDPLLLLLAALLLLLLLAVLLAVRGRDRRDRKS